MQSARKENVDFNVMGSHGRGVMRGLLIGSVTSKGIANGETRVAISR